MNKYYDSHFKKDVVTIYPGEYYSTAGSEMISTVLGSCVSIALFDTTAKVCGLNHFMLAKDTSMENGSDILMGKFGEYAIDLLIEDLEKKGGRLDRFSAKVFGGSNVFNLPQNTGAQVGEVNSKFALSYLQQKNIPIICSNVGGVLPRKIFLDPVTNKVFLKFINNNRINNSGLIEKEKGYLKKIESMEKGVLSSMENLFSVAQGQ